MYICKYIYIYIYTYIYIYIYTYIYIYVYVYGRCRALTQRFWTARTTTVPASPSSASVTRQWSLSWSCIFRVWGSYTTPDHLVKIRLLTIHGIGHPPLVSAMVLRI